MSTTKDHLDPGYGWVAVDFDATLAHYEKWGGPAELGVPIPAMVYRVKRWLAEGREVRIFTARCWPRLHVKASDAISHHDAMAPCDNTDRVLDSAEAVAAIRNWCREHLGRALDVTCVKDIQMIELYDDRAVQVEANTGRLIGGSSRGLT